ncbi:MAG: hypothetical protein RBS39_07780 [Phycisphaerales bacterium]|jgi:hypothetical protein|nr:hypothetical protein [Phycisphaerales bacterium]
MSEPTIPPPQDWMLPISEPATRAPACPCGYLLDGLATRDGLVRCPECGKEQRGDGAYMNGAGEPTIGWAIMMGVLFAAIASSIPATFMAFLAMRGPAHSLWSWRWTIVGLAVGVISLATYRCAKRLAPRSAVMHARTRVLAYGWSVVLAVVPWMVGITAMG